MLDYNNSCEDCFPSLGDRCVRWTGPSIECVGIEKGKSYDYNIAKLANKLCEHINQEVELKCLYRNDCDSCDSTVKIPEAVQSLINKICSLTSDDISHNGTLFCLNENLSSKASLLDGRVFDLSISPSVDKNGSTSVFYDVTGATIDLPEGVSFSGVTTSLNGKEKNGRTRIVDSRKESASFSVDYDRYPLDMNVKLNFHTEDGDIVLEKEVHIPDSVSYENKLQFNSRSFISSTKSTYSQKDINEAIASNVCSLKTRMDSIEEIDIAGCEAISYPSKKTKSVIGKHSSVLCDHEKRISDIEEVEVLVCGDGDCADTYESKSIVDAIVDLSKKLCELQKENKELQARCDSLEESINSVSSNCDSCSGGDCSGSTTGGGGCPGGNCG